MQTRDGADGERAGRKPELAFRGGNFLCVPRPAELLERDAEIHHFHFRRIELARVDHEVGGAVRDRQRDVGCRLEHSIGDLLIPRRIGQIGVFVDDRRNAAQRTRQPAERGGAVPVQMKDVDLLLVDDAEQIRQRSRIEFRSLEIGDVDPERVERFL